jgi:hypothetical protein
MKKIRTLFSLVLLMVLAWGCNRQQGMVTLVLTDTSVPGSEMTTDYLFPYLDHFGIVYEAVDVQNGKPALPASDYALVIIGNKIREEGKANKLLSRIIAAGAGVVSFDPGWHSEKPGNDTSPFRDSILTFDKEHYITALHPEQDTVKCFHAITFQEAGRKDMKPVVYAGGKPFVTVTGEGEPKEVIFASSEWMKTEYLGPLMGMDDCLWRSMVWAARKPFVMRGLPPLVTMRVDDVAGRGEIWGESPLYWVGSSIEHGFKPWLGLFIYNLNPEAINELRGYLISGNATAAPHALGRPNRTGVKKLLVQAGWIAAGQDFYAGFYYNPDALPLREDDYDEFIYFEHQKGIPWSDEEAEIGLEAVDKWYHENQPLPMSKYFIAHFYEMGHNIIPHITKKWGMEFVAMNKAIDMPYADTVPWIKGGPFRLYEEPGTSTNNPSLRGKNPVYYADFVDINGDSLFNCFTEIRDVAGYEWAPDNNVEASADRGIRELRRALSGMDLAVLFTHETDYIYRISPGNWDRQLAMIVDGINDFHPMMMTSDDALKIVRAQKTSQLTDARTNRKGGDMVITLSGNTDTGTYVYLFEEKEGEIRQTLHPVPEFNGGTDVVIKGGTGNGQENIPE